MKLTNEKKNIEKKFSYKIFLLILYFHFHV